MQITNNDDYDNEEYSFEDFEDDELIFKFILMLSSFTIRIFIV